MNTEQIFAYPDLEPDQKLELERSLNAFDLRLVELDYLLSTPFPFDKQARLWLERYVELSQLYLRQEDPVLDPTMARWVKGQRLYRQRGRMPLERERALNRIRFVWKLREESWQKQYEQCRVLQNNPQAYDAKKRLHSVSGYPLRVKSLIGSVPEDKGCSRRQI